MTPDEVRMLDNKYALLFIRGEKAIKDLKYDIMRHPAIKMTPDGGAPPYMHGEAWDAKQTIELASVSELPDDAIADELIETSYVLLSEEDVANEIKGIGTGHRMMSADVDEEVKQEILSEIQEEQNNEDEA